MKYGFSYLGSKSRLADSLLSVIPSASVFVDLFAGGCAMTHAALLSPRFGRVVCNDLQGSNRLFVDAVNGKFRGEKRFISREQFFAEKDTDHYVRWIWSFGNGGRTYLFGKHVEDLKRQAHEYLFANGYDGTAKSRVRLLKEFKASRVITDRFDLQQLERLQQLQHLERLERLQQLENLGTVDRLECFTTDYRRVVLPADSVVYCDPPYAQVKTKSKEKYYGSEFDTQAFYEWVKQQTMPVYFSSVFCDDSDFDVVWEKQQVIYSSPKGNSGKTVERLYWNGIDHASKTQESGAHDVE